MLNILTLGNGWRKCAFAMLCCIFCAASFFSMWEDGWVNWFGKGYGVPFWRGFMSREWIEAKGGMGYPISEGIEISAMLCWIVLCASSFKDAAKLAAANFFGIVCLGLLAFSADYVEPCTHDTVLAGAWLAGIWAIEDSKRLRWLLGSGIVAMALGIGELWHALGGSWCPVRESERLYGEFWMLGLFVVCCVAVCSKIIAARLGLEAGLWQVRGVAAVLGLGVAFGLSQALGVPGHGKFGAEEFGGFFGVALPLCAFVLNLALAAAVAVMRIRKKVSGYVGRREGTGGVAGG